MNVGNQLFNLCVGVGVGGHDARNFSYKAKDVQENSTSLDTNPILGDGGAKMVVNKKRPKNEIYGSGNCVGSSEIK